MRLEGGQVRLGIEAPREIAVVRAELREQRRGGMPAPQAATAEAPAVAAAPAPARVTTRPAEAPGIGIRRRGPSR